MIEVYLGEVLHFKPSLEQTYFFAFSPLNLLAPAVTENAAQSARKTMPMPLIVRKW